MKFWDDIKFFISLVICYYIKAALNYMVKEFLRSVLIQFKFGLTKNLKYDILTREIIKNQIKKNDNCIDIGCHKGEILKLMIHAAPQGQHYAFEPIPSFYHNLESKFEKTVSVFPYAIAEYHDKTTFNIVENAPAYSGLIKRKYDLKIQYFKRFRWKSFHWTISFLKM